MHTQLVQYHKFPFQFLIKSASFFFSQLRNNWYAIAYWVLIPLTDPIQLGGYPNIEMIRKELIRKTGQGLRTFSNYAVFTLGTRAKLNNTRCLRHKWCKSLYRYGICIEATNAAVFCTAYTVNNIRNKHKYIQRRRQEGREEDFRRSNHWRFYGSQSWTN